MERRIVVTNMMECFQIPQPMVKFSPQLDNHLFILHSVVLMEFSCVMDRLEQVSLFKSLLQVHVPLVYPCEHIFHCWHDELE